MGYYDNYLEHHGILGQKWGIRRFQKKDGTLTPAGKKHKQEEDSTDSKTKVYSIKKDSNGISYGNAKTRDSIEQLADSMTVEGVNMNTDSDRQMFVNYLKNKGVDTKNLAIITISGKDMNNAFKLTGDNAYKDDLHLQAFSGLDHSEAYRALSGLGCRWMEDIIANNSDREVKHSEDFSFEEVLEHHGILGMKWGVRRYQRPDGTRTELGKKRERGEVSGDAQNSHQFDKEKAKKIAKGVAIGAGVTAAAVGAGLWAKEYHNMPQFLKDVLKKEGQTKIKELETAAAYAAIKGGKAAVKTALATSGSIAAYKIFDKITAPKEGESELQKAGKVIVGESVKEGILSATNGKNYKGGNNQNNNNQNPNSKVDKSSKEYNELFNGLGEEDRKRIKNKANQGATMEELKEFRNSLNHSAILEWADNFGSKKFRW